MSHNFKQDRMRKPEYVGRFFDKVPTDKSIRKEFRHPIFLYSPAAAEKDKQLFNKLNQIVNIYDHTIPDFIMNTKRIIDHYIKNYGMPEMSIYTLGQSIKFRVIPKQEPFNLSLFAFFINYVSLILPITMKADLSNWSPFLPVHWTSKAWCQRIDEYIEMCRPLGNYMAINECLEYTKHLMKLWASKVGNRIALSMDNNMFIELMNRSEFVRETIQCTFDIPEDIEPNELEKLTTNRTNELLNFTSKQYDIPISLYARNNLFNPIQAREFFVHFTHKPDLSGSTIPYTYHTNNIMGTAHPLAHMIDAYGGRKAEILKLNVSDAGALERSLSMMMSPIRFVDTDWECDSKHFRTRTIESADVLDKLDGRVCTLDPKSDEYLIIDPKNTSLIGKTVYMKTPITCTHPRRSEGYICSACYGKLIANLNRNVHIGRLAALNSADDIEQLLLSAKHALNTHTREVSFGEDFNQYFETENCMIYFNSDMIDLSTNPESDFKYMYLEFYPATMKKYQDGEGRQYDRAVNEIIIYNKKTDTRTIIKEENDLEIFLSQSFINDFFIPAYRYVDDKKGVVSIPFTDLIDNGKPLCDEIFEYKYSNNELADAILTLTGIMEKGSRINSFSTYNECLDTLIPLFTKGGIHIPELQCEMLISQMIYTPDGKAVDWNDPNPEYKFFTIDKSVQNNNSALTSLLYQDTIKQLEGNYRTYEKTGTSAYDWFLLQRGSSGSVSNLSQYYRDIVGSYDLNEDDDGSDSSEEEEDYDDSDFVEEDSDDEYNQKE